MIDLLGFLVGINGGSAKVAAYAVQLFTLMVSSPDHPAISLFIGERILHGLADIFGGIVLLVIGILIIILLVAAAIVLLPAIIVAIIVWLLTGSFFYAGIAFLIVALISLVAMA